MSADMHRESWLFGIAIILSAAMLLYTGIGIGTGIANSFNTTVGGIPNTTIANRLNYTLEYVDMVNSSAYLIFYPNLAKAYSYIDEANTIADSDPARAAFLLNTSIEYSRAQLQRLNGLRYYSLIVMIIITALLGFGMYRMMRAGG